MVVVLMPWWVLLQDMLVSVGFSVSSHDIELHESMDITKPAGFAQDPQSLGLWLSSSYEAARLLKHISVQSETVLSG